MESVKGDSEKAKELGASIAKTVLAIGTGIQALDRANRKVHGSIRESGYKQTRDVVQSIKQKMMESKEPLLEVSKKLANYTEYLESIAKRDAQ